MAAQWKTIADHIPLRKFTSVFPESTWSYRSVAATESVTEDQHHSHKSILHRFHAALSSRIIWKCLLVLTLVLILFDLSNRFAQEDPPSHIEAGELDWSQFAYCQYVTNEDYLRNSVMIFESLHRLGSQASRVMMYPHDWNVDASTHRGQLLTKARDEYSVELQPIEVQRAAGDPTWAESFTKLLAFNQTQYKRVLSLDSDATALQSMDELFLLPPAPVAMPRAYWLENESTLSSQVVLVEPSVLQMDRLIDALKHRKNSDYDMELINNLYGKDCIIIPHRRYDLLTGEFRSKDHRSYLGSSEELWDPEYHYSEAKYLHFSDWPLPKPWRHADAKQKEDIAPACENRVDDSKDCRNREKWFYVYDEFHDRRQVSNMETYDLASVTIGQRVCNNHP
ncbi:hypothetical protein CKM354_001235200 [Cercospora kikuchii]|uniref:Nucleotide-diphospho-sugar transferase n=1 Tax=Cercospora kikuchii TaxID=84275 RepID=A0A9P3FLV9_9PEZI|nr:uncharacterized protein CKM354_001235200 [Cercospora kikuchii]GIZ49320.1 hypothetical protein CKM354_001235200 [Cercospora kikuchii]